MGEHKCLPILVYIVYFSTSTLVGEREGRGTLYLFELVGECVNLYVGWGRDGRGKVGRTNEDQGKDVVPLFAWITLPLQFG